MQTETTPNRHALPLLVAWLVILIPATWGVTQTVKRSLQLFHSSPAPTTQTAPK